jgi:AcrR family transcriptional regulator
MKAIPRHAARRPADTRGRLIHAAARIFARDGIAGSTTREIAREAGVNEVTLFRHFLSKDGLISAVVGQNFGNPLGPKPPAAVKPTGDLRHDLLAHARRYDQLLRDNLPLIRTMIGEIQHHGDHERMVFKAIFRPLREALVARLQTAVAAGQLRADTPAELTSDLFSGMIFTGVLRRANAHIRIDYTASRYIEAAVDLILRGAGRAS